MIKRSAGKPPAKAWSNSLLTTGRLIGQEVSIELSGMTIELTFSVQRLWI
jgi:hypothetical protein